MLILIYFINFLCIINFLYREFVLTFHKTTCISKWKAESCRSLICTMKSVFKEHLNGWHSIFSKIRGHFLRTIFHTPIHTKLKIHAYIWIVILCISWIKMSCYVLILPLWFTWQFTVSFTCIYIYIIKP